LSLCKSCDNATYFISLALFNDENKQDIKNGTTLTSTLGFCAEY